MSALLSADDLNDFISPGVACIKPLASSSTNTTTTTNTTDSYNENGEVEIQIDSQGNPLEISKIDDKQFQTNKLTPAQISLADCLACSGCITSAEEVLVAQHSHQELIKALQSRKETNKVFVVSISHQSRASLAMAYNVSIENMDKCLIDLFIRQMGFTYIVGTSLGRKLSLINEAKEIINRKTKGSGTGGIDSDSSSGPILSSICPGWVLYAEKTHPYIIPKMSTVKSPQQITGCLLKNLTSNSLNIEKSKIYHLSIMPCFDKKLESARPEVYEEEEEEEEEEEDKALVLVPDVDCVITAKELITLLEECPQYQLIPPTLPQEELIGGGCLSMTEIYKQYAPPNWPFIEISWSNDSGSASGGYAYNYLTIYRNDLILKGYDGNKFTINLINGRNPDIYEMRLMYNGENKEKLASAAVVNGFRNIQNLVRKLKPNTGKTTNTTTTTTKSKVNPLAARRRARMANNRGKPETKSTSEVNSQEMEIVADASKVDYVEIMACPNGCINGGGQISAPNTTTTTSITLPQKEIEKQWINAVLEKYNSIPMFDLSSQSSSSSPNEIIKFIEWSKKFENQFNINDNRLFKTHFNPVEKNIIMSVDDPATALLVGSKW